MPSSRAHLRSTSPSCVPILMKSLRKALGRVPDERPPRGLLDTSVVLELEQTEVASLPIEVAISAITMAELAAGTHATSDAEERARRQDRLQRAEAAFHPLPFDGEAARAYGLIYAPCRSREHRSGRISDPGAPVRWEAGEPALTHFR